MKDLLNLIYRHRYDIFLSLVLISTVIFMCFVFPLNETKNIITSIENSSFDLRQKIISKHKTVNKDIVLVSIDDPSYEYLVETYGEWPIPRKVHAEIIDYIESQNPKYIIMEFQYIKSLWSNKGSDEKLINAFKKYPNVYTVFVFDNYSYELRQPPVIDKKLTTELKIDSDTLKIPKYKNCRIIMEEIIKATDKIGHTNEADKDSGIIRTIPLIANYPLYNDKNYEEIKDQYFLYNTLKLSIDYFNKYENANISEIKIDKNNNLILGKRKIKLNEKGEVILNWYGESGLKDENKFKYVSFWKILKSSKAKREKEKELIPKDFFKDKIVYVGGSVFQLSDVRVSPTSMTMPMPEVNATLLNNILDNSLIKKADLSYNLLICLILGLSAIYTVIKIRSIYSSVTMFLIFLGFYLYFATYIMEKYNIWVWIAIPVVSSFIAFIFAFIIKYLIKSRDFEYTYKLATTDGLTNLYNHRYFQEQMKLNTDKSKKLNKTFSLIMIDIDFFKKFNDKYGHQAGDAVLKHVASTIKSCVRVNDIVCRYGGEEMAVILENTDKKSALITAQKICETIASKRYNLSPDVEVTITISLGVATYPENGNTPSELIEYADKCLYCAKENGRNQVGFFN